jgi:hypothetical protein
MEPELMTKVGRRLDEAFSLKLRGELLFAIAEGKLPVVPALASIASAALNSEREFWRAIVGTNLLRPLLPQNLACRLPVLDRRL